MSSVRRIDLQLVEVHVLTVRRAELSKGRLEINEDSAKKIVAILQKAGVAFIPARGGGAGVR